MSSYLITGASRGIGFELTKQLSTLPTSKVSIIFAVTRSKSAQLDGLISSNTNIINIQISNLSSPSDVAKAANEVKQHLGGKGLDVLINDTGVMPITKNWTGKTWDVEPSELNETVNTNVVTVHVMIAGFLELLRQGQEKKIVNISTTLGSITMARRYPGATHSYKITKAALNMLSTQYAIELESEGFAVVLISPGWLKTDLGCQYPDLEVPVGVKAVVDLIMGVDASKNGKSLNIHVPGWENAEGPNQYDGREIPW